MQQVTLSALAALISSSERARVIKNGAVVFADWGYYLKDWQKLGLMPPLDQESTPQYIAGDMRINMYYDIYI